MTIFASRLRSVSYENLFSNNLRTYFRCGWAFFIPYLAVYLLYAWLRWPVNPVDGGQWTVVPCLLHVYWVLHAVHLVLGALALCAWWQAGGRGQGAKREDPLGQPATNLASHESGGLPAADRLLSTGYRLLPWICLALLFYIPGIYLEWPSDPWDHLRRINEWQILDHVTAHSAWKKSGYILPYSLTQHVSGLTQLSWLNFYYITVCLLLSWQYYRLARAVGLSERASFVFVLLNALTFGNNIFSFYRYYGLSSSIIAQIGAVALTRIALEVAQNPQLSLRTFFRPEFTTHRLSLITAAPALLALTAFNHIQGIGIAGLGVLAVIVWRLIEWKRVMILWLGAAAVAASIAVVMSFPRHSALDEVFRPQSWLTGWYGFNFYSLSSPALDRSLHILGFFGVLNLILGGWLIMRRNHSVGWLTLLPIAALALPCFALPFCHLVAANTSPGNIVTFHRMLLAVPMGLALVTVSWAQSVDAISRNQETGARKLPYASFLPAFRAVWSSIPIPMILLALAITPGRAGYNRFWHSILNTHDDLQLRHYISNWNRSTDVPATDKDFLVIDTPLGHEMQQSLSPSDNVNWERLLLINTPVLSNGLGNRLQNVDAIIHLFDSQSTFEDSTRLDRLTLVRRAVTQKRIIAVPTSTAHTWVVLGGVAPMHTFANGQLTISNPVGNDSVTFNPDLIPISRNKRYRLSCRVRQTGSMAAKSFLAVAWYDQDMRFLPSRMAQPQGAGTPRGWDNSTYSHYGLVDQPAPTTWADYSISFGLGEDASIPANASYLRIGALLNYRAIPGANVEITDVTLIEKPLQSRLMITAPGYWHLHTPASQSAILSGHWTAQHVPTAHAGTQELRSISRKF